MDKTTTVVTYYSVVTGVYIDENALRKKDYMDQYLRVMNGKLDQTLKSTKY